ncbi:MAG: hypothetical protein PF481_00310 [Bacteroidales bacterium]|jgi:hypothetical protein|nr:hypothetical protein [Bacteroidales bacterium]
MRYLKYITLALIVAFTSCEFTDPLNDDLEEIGNEVNVEINYTLSDDDYSTLYDHILYRDSSDAANAEFILANKYFTDDIPATNYIPIILDVIRPNLAGAKANVTFNYNGEATKELTKIANADSYTITHSNYEQIDSTLGFINYFAPPYIPADYIPNILKHNVKYEGTNDTVVVEYLYSDNAVKVDFNKKINAELSESFENGDLGLFSSVNTKGSQSWSYVPKDNGAVSISGYDDVYYDNEDWLVSPVIDLASVTNTYLRIRHNVRYYESGSLLLLVTTDTNSDVSEAQWSEYQIDNPETEINEYVYSELFNLSAYDESKIRVALKYTSSVASSVAPEWSVSEIKVGNYGYSIIGGGDNYLVQQYYQFDSIDALWTPIDNIYRLNQSDFSSLDLNTTAFSESMPAKDYLPELANNLYPNAAAEGVVYFVYNYEAESTVTIADKLTKTETGWLSAYSYVQEAIEPYRNTDNIWRFDPSEIIEMTADDYQIVIDYVNSVPEYAEHNSSTYSNSEYYFGASAYYGNFDIRSGSFYEPVLDTWQNAVITALLEGFLPNKYPNATQYVNGVEVFYYITFQTYSGSSQNYTCTFGVSKDAPNPEFYLVDGPTEAE